MKTCLIISAFFPPIGGVGVQRICKFVKYLPQSGWRPIVVTLPSWSTRMPQDPSLLSQIPDSVPVHRPFFFDYRKIIPGEISRWLRPVLIKFSTPDRYISWNSFALRRIDRIATGEKIDAVLVNVSPFSSLLLAAEIHHRRHLPVVVTLRDAFSFNNYYLRNNRAASSHAAATIEEATFPHFKAILCVTPFMLKKYRSLYPQWRDKFQLLTNGYDEEDFAGVADPDDDDLPHFTIGYNGSVSRLAPIEPLLRALSAVRRSHGITIKLNIASRNSLRDIYSYCPECRQDDLVDYKGFLPHRQSLANLRASHLVAILFANDPATEGAYSGKIFEYLRLGKPILLLHRKDSDLARLLRRTKTGMTVDIDDQQEIIATLLALQKKWRQGRLSHQLVNKSIRSFEYRHLTGQLTAFLADRSKRTEHV